MSDFFASAAGGGGGGGMGGEGMGGENRNLTKPTRPDEWDEYKEIMNGFISRDITLCNLVFDKIGGDTIINKFVNDVNENYPNCALIFNINGNPYVSGVSTLEFKMFIHNEITAEESMSAIHDFGTFIDKIEEAKNEIILENGSSLSNYINNPTVLYQKYGYVPHVTIEGNAQTPGYFPMWLELSEHMNKGIVEPIDTKYYKFQKNSALTPFYTFFKFIKEKPDSNQKKFCKKTCGYFEYFDSYYKLFMFKIKATNLIIPMLYLFNKNKEEYLGVIIEKSSDQSQFVCLDFVTKALIFPLREIMTIRSHELDYQSDDSSYAGSSQDSSQGLSPRSTLFKPIFKYPIYEPPVFPYEQYVISADFYEKGDEEDHENNDDDWIGDPTIREEIAGIKVSDEEHINPSDYFSGRTNDLSSLNCSYITSPESILDIKDILKNETQKQYLCKLIFSFMKPKNKILPILPNEIEIDDISKITVLDRLVKIKFSNLFDQYFNSYILEQRLSVFSKFPCNRIIHYHGDGTVKISIDVVEGQNPNMSSVLATYVLNQLPPSLEGSMANIPIVEMQTIKHAIAVLTNRKFLNPDGTQMNMTVDEIIESYYHGFYCLFRRPDEVVGDPSIFDLFGNFVRQFNELGLGKMVLAGGGAFALCGIGKIADIDLMVLCLYFYFQRVKEQVIRLIKNLVTHMNGQNFFPGRTRIYFDDGRRYYEITFLRFDFRQHLEDASIKNLISIDMKCRRDEYFDDLLIGSTEYTFAILDIVIKKFGIDIGTEFVENEIKSISSAEKKEPDEVEIFEKFKGMYVEERPGYFACLNPTGLNLTVITTLNGNTINPKSREMQGKLKNETTRPEFVLKKYQEVKNFEGSGEFAEIVKRTLTNLEILKSQETVTADRMNDSGLYILLLQIVMTCPTEVSKYLYETLMMPKIKITVLENLEESKERFSEKINAKQGTIIYSSSTKLSVQEEESVQESIELDTTGQATLVPVASGGGGGSVGGRFAVLEESEDEPEPVFAFTGEVVPNSGGGSYEDDLKTRLKQIGYKEISEFAKIYTKELKRIGLRDQLMKRKSSGVKKEDKLLLINAILQSEINKQVIEDFINTKKGGARRTRHRANKPMKTRKHRNRGANRNTRKRRPRKTIRK